MTIHFLNQCWSNSPKYIHASSGINDLHALVKIYSSCVDTYHITPHVTSQYHYDDVIMGLIASQITSLTIVYSTVYSGADQSKYQSSASLAFVWGIHRGPVNSSHKWPVTRKMLPFDDVIMTHRFTTHTTTRIHTWKCIYIYDKR